METVTEDAHTALKLQRMGWDTAFLAIPLAAGLATERLSLHIGQRARWARGMCQIFRVDNPLFGKGLKIGQRLCYLNAMMHFQFPLPRFVFVTAPLAYLLFGANIIAAAPDLLLAYALPHLFHAIYTNSVLQGRYRYSFWGEIYETVLAFALIRPTLASLWNPSKGKFNVTDKGGTLDEAYFDSEAVRPHLITLALLLAGIIWGAVRMVFSEDFAVNPFVLGLNLVWALLNVTILLAAVAVAMEAKQVRNAVRVGISLPAVLHLSNGHTARAETCDFSMGGMRLSNPYGDAFAEETVEDVEISFDGKAMLFPVSPITADPHFLRFRFQDLPLRQRRKLVNVVMGRADAWVPDKLNAADHPFRSFSGVLRAVTGLFSSGNRDNAWLRWQRNLFGNWKFLLVLTTVIALGWAIVANRAWAGEADFSRQISLQDAGFDKPITINGNGNSFGVHFSIRKDEVVTGATFKLSFSYPDSTFPRGALLEVSLNGQHLEDIELDAFRGDGFSTDIKIRPEFIVSQNDLNFRIRSQQAITCSAGQLMTERQNKVLIDQNSVLNLKLLRLPRPDSLENFPAPFFDEGIMRHVSIPVVLPENADGDVYESGAIVASYFGSLVSFRSVSFPVHHGRIPAENSIAFVIGNQIAGITLSPLEGPEIRLIANPVSPLNKLLLVMGRNSRELKQASEYLVSGAPLTGKRQLASVLMLPQRHAYDAPNWIDTSMPVTLGELTSKESLTARGIYHEANEVNFRAPPDIFRWRSKPIKMDVHYLFPEGEWLNERTSRLNITLNGQYLTSLPVNAVGVKASVMQMLGDDIRQQRAIIEIPPSLLYGENKLEFYFDLQIHPASDCKNVMDSNIVSRVLPTSTIDFSDSEHFTALPNLSYFVSSGFPFTRMADLSDSLVMLPEKPATEEIATFLAVMARMGQSTGLPAYKVDVRLGITGGVHDTGKDVLLFGYPDQLEPALAGSVFHVADHKISLDEGNLVSNWRAIIAGDWSRELKQAKRQLDALDNFAGILSFLSPHHSDNVVVVMTASQSESWASLVTDLASSQVAKEAIGDLLVFNNQYLRAFHVGTTKGSGNMSWDKSIRWYFGNHVLLLLVLMLGAILLAATLLYRILSRHADQRLSGTKKNDHD